MARIGHALGAFSDSLLEKFRADYPVGSKTAFIIMQFGATKPHNALVACIKQTLKKYGIAALRADDKEYMDDLFPNIKTYMHACMQFRHRGF